MNLGPYELLSEVGRGGAGVVYRARSRDGRDVAVKLVHRPGAPRLSSTAPSGDSAFVRFERERRLLGELGEEQGFVPLLDAGDSPRGPWIAMPFVPGGTLRDRIERGPLAIDEVVAIGRRLAAGLGRAHARGIVHRDVKPENVLFTGEGRPLIADLGIAKHFQEEGHGASVSLSKTGEIRGTIGYMAREQMHDAKAIGPASDVFSLAAVLYECLTGRPAFTGETIVEVMSRVEQGDYVPLRQIRPEVPRLLAATIDRALAREPSKRWKDGEAFARALGGELRSSKRWSVVAAVVAVVATAAIAMLSRGAPAAEEPRAVAPAPPPKPEPRPVAAKLQRAGTLGRPGLERAAKVRAVAWDGARRLAVTGNLDTTLRVIDLASGRETRTIDASKKSLECVTMSSDGKLALAGGWQKRAFLVNVDTGVLLATLEVGAVVQAVAISADGSLALLGSDDGMATFWRLSEPPERAFVFHGPQGTVGAVGIAPDGAHALVSGSDFAVQRIDLRAGKNYSIHELGRHRARVAAIAFSRDGKLALTGSFDQTARVWDIDRARERISFGGHQGPISWVALSPDGARAATIGSDGLRVWDVATGRELEHHSDRTGRAYAVAFHDDGRLIDLTTGETAGPLCGHTSAVVGLAFSPDGARAVSLGDDRIARAWDVAAGRELAALERKTVDVAWTDGGPYFIEDASVMAWDVGAASINWRARGDGGLHHLDASGGFVAAASDHEVLAFPVGGDPWHGVEPRGISALSTRAGRVVTLGVDRMLRAFDARTHSQIASFELREAPTSLAVSGDGRAALVGGRAGIQSVTLENGALPRSLATTRSPVRALACEAGRVVAAFDDGSIALYELATGKLLDRSELKPDAPTSLALSADGGAILVGTARGPILRYEISER